MPGAGSSMSSVRMMLMATATLVALASASSPVVAQQKNDKASKDQVGKRPKVTLRAQPQVAIAPARVTLTAELVGGADDFEEFYCPSVVWDWGDDTSSESSIDCEPYEAGRSQIKRRYTVQHLFRRPGTYRLYFHLKQKERFLGSATFTIQVQPGLSSGPDGL